MFKIVSEAFLTFLFAKNGAGDDLGGNALLAAADLLNHRVGVAFVVGHHDDDHVRLLLAESVDLLSVRVGLVVLQGNLKRIRGQLEPHGLTGPHEELDEVLRRARIPVMVDDGPFRTP